jgi:hypothetical protein
MNHAYSWKAVNTLFLLHFFHGALTHTRLNPYFGMLKVTSCFCADLLRDT